MEEERKIYLTKEGLERFRQEYESLKQIKKATAKNGAPSVGSLQDIDSEFSAFQEDLRLLESRIEELEAILKSYSLITPPPKHNRKTVFLGATVRVEVEGQEDEFTIVGSLEANPALGKISNESLVGKSLLGRRLGEEVKVQSAVVTVYKIKKIIYNF